MYYEEYVAGKRNGRFGIEMSNGKRNESCLMGGTNEQEHQPASLEVLDRVKIINSLESPISTIKGVLLDVKEKNLNFSKEELRNIEEMLKTGFVEFYHKLHLLNKYR